jgi:hypothetical protein
VTQNRSYILTVRRDGSAWISGHSQFCPEPVLVRIAGSNWGRSMLKSAYLGRGTHLEFEHPNYRTPIVTSPIVDIRVRPGAWNGAGPRGARGGTWSYGLLCRTCKLFIPSPAKSPKSAKKAASGHKLGTEAWGDPRH